MRSWASRLLGGLLGLLALGACTQKPQTVLVRLWSEDPHIPAYVEAFNLHQKAYFVVLEPGNAQKLKTDAPIPDGILSWDLESWQVQSQLKTLEPLLQKNPDLKTSLVPGILASGQGHPEVRILPLGYDPFLVLYAGDLHKPVPPVLDLEQILKANREFNQKTLGRRHLGISPSWSVDLTLALAGALGVGFTDQGTGKLHWKPEGWAAWETFLRTWVDQDNLGTGNDSDFTKRYLDSHPRDLLNAGNILYYPQSVTQFLQTPREFTRNLGYSFLSFQGKILVRDRVIALGIPEKAKNPQGIEAFILWMRSGAGGVKTLQSLQGRPLRFPGGGLSAWKDQGLWLESFSDPRPFEGLLGAEAFWFPSVRPETWEEIRDLALGPWIQGFLRGEAPGDFRSFSQKLGINLDS